MNDPDEKNQAAAEAEDTGTPEAETAPGEPEGEPATDEPGEGEAAAEEGSADGATDEAGLDLSRSKLAEQPAPEGSEKEAEAEEPAAPVDLAALGRTIEALLFASETPLTPREMARAAGVRTADVRKAIVNLREQLEEQHRPYELAEIANGYQLVTRPEHHPAIQKLKAQRVQRKLTQAGLETLALIAYSKDPIARAEIESVRGVDAGPVLRLLLDRKLIKIAGRGTGLGQPLLYTVSNEFLEHFGLKSAADLPKPGEFKSA